MRFYFLLFFVLYVCIPVLAGQSAPPIELEGGYTNLSNSFNGLPGSRKDLNGFDASVAFRPWHNLRPAIEVSHYSGTNLGARQNALFIVAGGRYERTIRREKFFAEALFGDMGINKYWGPNAHQGDQASFAAQFGGGFDTPIDRHFAIRLQGDYRYEYLALATMDSRPYRIPGLPTNFASLSSGLVWTPSLGSSFAEPRTRLKRPIESELQFEYLNCFGHLHIFVSSWWSYLQVAGVEYDRHSWGKFIGARMDYVAEVLPISIFKQPSETDEHGRPVVSTFTTIYGLGISPIGLRMMWRDGKTWKPYYTIKGGLIGFNKKAISSQYGSYVNLSLQQSIGMQVRLTRRWDMHAGIEHFHFSNNFVVPVNPGIDEMSYNAALSLRLGKTINGSR